MNTGSRPEFQNVVPAVPAGQKKKSKKGKIILFSILGVVLALIIAVVAIVLTSNAKMRRYNAAFDAYNAQDYERAEALFRDLGDYIDAKEYAEKAAKFPAFDAALVLMEEGKFEEAKTAFEALGNFNGSKGKAEECALELKYRQAEALMREEKYTDAAHVYEELGKEDLAQDAWRAEYYKQGVEYYEAGEYELARQSFDQALKGGTYRDAEEYMKTISGKEITEHLDMLIAEGNYGEAIILLDNYEMLADYIEGFEEKSHFLLEKLEDEIKENEARAHEQKLTEAAGAAEEGNYYTAYKIYLSIGEQELADSMVQKTPSTGVLYQNPAVSSGSTSLTIIPPSDGSSTYFKIYDADDESILLRVVFIGPGDQATVYIPGGRYIFKAAYNDPEKDDRWWGENEMFGDAGTYQRLKNGSTDVFEIDSYSAYSLTLRASAGGNVGNRSEKAENF